MFRRRATDDEALAEAFRRLDGAGASSATVAATTLAEAERIDAALRTLLQPVAAPDTLAGRVAGEVGRARRARLRRGSVPARRPVWAMAFAGAAVVALVFGAALATAGRGGTIGERARGVGEWVRALLGVGVRGDGGDGVGDDDGVAPVGEGDAAYYWVPGMGILPLEPETMVSTGPVTVTLGSRAPRFSIVQLIADHNGTWLNVRAERPLPVGSRVFRVAFEEFDSGHASDDRDRFIRLNATGEASVELPGMEVGRDGRSVRLTFRAADDRGKFDAALVPAVLEVPVEPAAVPHRRAGPMGTAVTVGGLTLRAWTATVGPGVIAVRVEPGTGHERDHIVFGLGVGPDAQGGRLPGPIDPYAHMHYQLPGVAQPIEPAMLFAQSDRVLDAADERYPALVPRGDALPRSRFAARSRPIVSFSLPMTALFNGVGGGRLTLTRLDWDVDGNVSAPNGELEHFRYARYRLAIAEQPVIPAGAGGITSAAIVMERPETFEIGAEVTLLGRPLTLLKGVLVQRSDGVGLLLYVQPKPLPGQEWESVIVGYVHNFDRGQGNKLECWYMGAVEFHTDVPWGSTWTGLDTTTYPDSRTADLCFVRPRLHVAGPWTFR